MKIYLSASAQIAATRGQRVFHPKERQLSLCFLLGVSSVFAFTSYGFGHASLERLFLWVRVSAHTRYYTYLLEIVLLASATVFTFCQGDDVCLRRSYSCFLSIIIALRFSKNVAISTLSIGFHEVISIKC